jgi:hypothetical protein
LDVVRALYDATDGLPQQWRMLEELDATAMDAIEFAVARAWVIIEAGPFDMPYRWRTASEGIAPSHGLRRFVLLKPHRNE